MEKEEIDRNALAVAMRWFSETLEEKGYWNHLSVGDSGIAFAPEALGKNVALMAMTQGEGPVFPIALRTVVYMAEDRSSFVECKFNVGQSAQQGIHLHNMEIINHGMATLDFVKIELPSCPLKDIPQCRDAIRMVKFPSLSQGHVMALKQKTGIKRRR